jgi:SAM-dependent methyltransferase
MTEVFYEGCDLEALGNVPNYYSWIMETFAPYVRGHVIEYGAGRGTVSERLVPLSDKLILVEPSTNLADVLRARFCDDPKIGVINESLETNARQMAAEAVDTVVMVNVLEHIREDRGALSHLFRILKPGGHLLVFVPALQGLMSKFDLMHGHFRRYHKGDLELKVGGAGGDVHVCRYFDLAGVLPWLLLTDIYDKTIVPVSRVAERWLSPPIGKNLILVARKR